MAKQKTTCPHCGASMMEHRHALGESLIIGLSRLYDAGMPVNIKELGLTRNQWDNFQKLRYWGLAQKFSPSGNPKSGVWVVSDLGRQFIEGRATVHRNVWTYRGEAVRFEGVQVSVHDLHPIGYRKHEDYAADAVAHSPGSFVRPPAPLPAAAPVAPPSKPKTDDHPF